MTIQDFKKEFGFTTLSMVRQLDKNGAKQDWLSHWDNERQIRVSMHQNVFKQIKQNIEIDNLDYRQQLVPTIAGLRQCR